MKMAALKPRESRIAAILLLLVTLVLAYFLLLHWWFVAPLQKIHGDMAELRDTQSRYAAAIAEKPALQKRIAALGAGQAASSAFLAADDQNTASADLMQRVVDVVGNNTS
jgi:general secretion pathway protein M